MFNHRCPIKKLNVWLVQIGEPLPLDDGVRKMRTALLAEKLLERGHSIYWWASSFEHQRKLWITNKRSVKYHLSENYTIHVMRGCGYKKNVSIMRYLDHLLIAKKFRTIAKEIKKPDVIIASMPCYHIAYESVCLAKKASIPVVIDIRDLWPDIFFSDSDGKKLKWLKKILLSRDFHKQALILKNATALTAMSNGILNWGLCRANRTINKWDKVFYLAYKEKKFDKNKYIPLISKILKEGKKIFTFVGTFGKSYELELVLNAASRMSDDYNNIVFFLVGVGENYQYLKKMSLGMKNVYLTGWLDADGICEVLDASWAGIIPCNSVLDSIPNKVFEYLSFGLPIISSLKGEVADFISNYNIGISYPSGNIKKICEAIKRLVISEDLRETMSENAFRLFKEKGDADLVYGDFAKHVQQIVESGALQQ